VPILLVLRWAVGHGIELGRFEICFDKWHLGIVRLIDFASASILLVRFQSIVKPLAVRPLVLLGQSSLQVFCSHLFFCFAGLTLMGTAERMSGWQQFALLFATLGAMLLTAKLFSRERPAGGTPVAPPLRVNPQVAR
jgi:hypothetical protein